MSHRTSLRTSVGADRPLISARHNTPTMPNPATPGTGSSHLRLGQARSAAQADHAAQTRQGRHADQAGGCQLQPSANRRAGGRMKRLGCLGVSEIRRSSHSGDEFEHKMTDEWTPPFTDRGLNEFWRLFQQRLRLHINHFSSGLKIDIATLEESITYKILLNHK